MRDTYLCYEIKQIIKAFYMEELKDKHIGAIVTDNYAASEVFAKYDINYYSQGDRSLSAAARQAGIDPGTLVQELEACKDANKLPFASWPTDLLIDYVLKIHHRNIREKGPELLALVQKVSRVHGDRDPELREIESLFVESIEDLLSHLDKEEQVLFPYLLELDEAASRGIKTGPMHCGSVIHPIGVMRMEHDMEAQRYTLITQLTRGYQAPEGACTSYRKMMADLKVFMTALYEHIHLENNILFLRAIDLEQKCVG